MQPSQEIYCSKSSKLKGKKIVLAVTGSIAAVEDVKLIRELIRHGGEIYPVMSRDAQKIVHPYALQFASGRPPITEIDGSVPYVDLCGEKHEAHLLLLAPCTANTISKIACGIDDTPVTTFATAALGSRVPLMIAPAMHVSMYKHPIVKENVSKLERLGVEFVEPKVEEEKAKMADIEEIVARVIRKIGSGDMSGEKVLVIAGSTQEAIDDIRFLTNKGTGGTGIELAKNAFERGADVELWMGRHIDPIPSYLTTKNFQSTEDLKRLVEKMKCDMCIVPASISDYSLKKGKGKIPSGLKSLTLELKPTPKIIERIRKKSDCTLIGFKAEWKVSEKELVSRAYALLKAHKLDFIVANDVSKVGKEATQVFAIDKKGKCEKLEGSKAQVAERIWSAVLHGIKG